MGFINELTQFAVKGNAVEYVLVAVCAFMVSRW